MKLVFMGTPAFAVPSLEKLANAGHEILAVYTQPDRPKGRGQKEAQSPVKEAALRLGLVVHQPERIRKPEPVEQLRLLAPECIIVVGYGQLIPKTILDLPSEGIINVHASLLPKYRGAAPIQWAIANGETRTGVTTMKINEGLDTGDILLKQEAEILPDENAVELSNRLSIIGAGLLIHTLDDLKNIIAIPQNHTEATLAPILRKEDGKIDWSMDARNILCRIRGFQPWPGGYGFWRAQRLQIWKARIEKITLTPGQIKADGKSLYAGAGNQSLEILELQLEGKKRMTAAAFLNGFTFSPVEVLQ